MRGNGKTNGVVGRYLKEWIHNSSPTTLVESSSETDEAAEDTVHVDSESNIKKTDGTDIAYQESLMHEQPITLTYQRTALRHRRPVQQVYNRK